MLTILIEVRCFGESGRFKLFVCGFRLIVAGLTLVVGTLGSEWYAA